MTDLDVLRELARALGVATVYQDGLGQRVEVAPETLVRVCAALGAALDDPAGAAAALAACRHAEAARRLPEVVVAWDGVLPALPAQGGVHDAAVMLDRGVSLPLRRSGDRFQLDHPLPPGYHRLLVDVGGALHSAVLLAAPPVAWRTPGGEGRSWGVSVYAPALRSSRSRSIGDLRDLGRLAHWLRGHGATVMSVLPLLPTFTTAPVECSPYAPVTRLFWSEALLDLGETHRPAPGRDSLDFEQADREVREALSTHLAPDIAMVASELARYAQFRGAQRRLGRDWRRWPAEASRGILNPRLVDEEEARFHVVAQQAAAAQVTGLRTRLDAMGMRLALDLAVGVHPDGYDTWSRQHLFASGMSVGAPPDAGFPSGQNWGFPPLMPQASRAEGHAYLAACLSHQMAAAHLLRLDHVMSLMRLYWIPQGCDVGGGTYVSYPLDELLAVLLLESHRHRTTVVGEDLGTVPPAIRNAMAHRGILGMFVAEFAAGEMSIPDPAPVQVAYVETHDTPPLAGWTTSRDLEESVTYGLMERDALPAARSVRLAAVHRLAEKVGARPEEPEAFLAATLEWLGRSRSPLVLFWLEDLWGEAEGVNLPGTPSWQRPNWQRPMRHSLDGLEQMPSAVEVLRRLDAARRAASPAPACEGS